MSNPEVDNYVPASAMKRIFDDIKNERDRQEELKAQGKFLKTCAERDVIFPDDEKLALLAKEFGEVAKEVTEKLTHDGRCRKAGNPKGCTDPMHKRRLRMELIQVAAVCVAWVEGLDKE